MDTCRTPQIYLVIFTGSHLPSQLTDHDKVACDCSDNLHYSQLCHKCNLWRRNFKWTDLTCLTTPWTVSKNSHIMYDINQFVHIDTNLHFKKQFWLIVALTTNHSPHLHNDQCCGQMHTCLPTSGTSSWYQQEEVWWCSPCWKGTGDCETLFHKMGNHTPPFDLTDVIRIHGLSYGSCH